MSMINVLPDEQALAVAAADHIAQTLASRQGPGGRASLVLTGGETPAKVYEALAERHAETVAWDRIDFFLGDERFVLPDHEESNFGMAREKLLSDLPASECEVFPYPTTLDEPGQAAEALEHTLRSRFAGREPAFDVVLFGLGEDGHVASLFPGSPLLDESERWVVHTRAPEGNPITDRLTMTFPLLNAGGVAIFLVAGEAKAEAVARVRAGEDLPGARVRSRGDVVWYLDQEAASQMQP